MANKLFVTYNQQNRLQLFPHGIRALNDLRDDQLFISSANFELPKGNEIAMMKDVFKKMLENQLKNPPKECIKFAR